MTDALLTRSQLALRLNLSVATVTRRLKAGELGIPTIHLPKPGGRDLVRFDPRDVDKFIARGGAK